MIRINGIPITPNPSSVERGTFRISNAERTADGTMMLEIIAVKRRVDIGWTYIRDSDYKALLDVIEQGGPFYQVTYPDPQAPGGERTITAYVGDINDSAWHTIGGQRWWRDVQVAFIER